MVEGSLWVYGQTRLADYYAGALSLRELQNRFLALPFEAPIWRVVEDEHEKAQAAHKASEVEDVLARFRQ